jgi:hypothetical protein
VEYLGRYVVGSSRSSTPETEMRDASSPRRMGSMMMVHNNASEIRTDGLSSLGFGITHMLQKRCRTKVAWKGECRILYTGLIRFHLTMRDLILQIIIGTLLLVPKIDKLKWIHRIMGRESTSNKQCQDPYVYQSSPR